MPIAKLITKDLTLPDGATARIRMLSYLTLDKADDEKSRYMASIAPTFAALKEYVPVAAAPAANGQKIEPTEEQKRRAEELRRIAKYDMRTVLKHGVVEWSYENAALPDALDELDRATAEFIFQAILDLTLVTEDDLKKGSSRSTAISAG